MKTHFMNALAPFILTAALLPALGHAAPKAGHAEAIFAGGCFWCMERPFDEVDGVESTTPGYTGGHLKNPTYKDVSSGRTGHAEALRVVYDPDKVSYDDLLKVFWANVDPTDGSGQFCDRGDEYRSEIFYIGADQKRAAMASLEKLKNDKPFSLPIFTRVTEATTFYPAEHYHQDYYKKNPVRYRYYRYACGRDARLEAVWSGKVTSVPPARLEDDNEEGGSWFSGFFGFFSSNP